MTAREKQIKIKNLMSTLNITKEEAEEILEADLEIDRGEKLFELPDDLKAGAKKARQADRKSPAKINRERKVDEEKKMLLENCQKALAEAGAEILEMKTETEISFSFGENQYTLKLTKHRPPK